MIAVSAATGKTGAQVVAALTARGVPHVSWSSRPGQADRRFDWTDRSTWAAALAGVDTLYLVKPAHGQPMAGLVEELLGTGADLRRVVLLSEMAREAKPDADPDRAVERVVERWTGEWTLLRPGWFLQNVAAGGGYHRGVMAGRIEIATGDAPLSWIDTRDVAEVAVAALTTSRHVGAAHTLTGPEAFGVTALATRLGDRLGREITAAPRADEDALRAASVGGTEREAYLADLLLDVIAGRFAPVTDTVERVLGRPARTFDGFWADHRQDWN